MNVDMKLFEMINQFAGKNDLLDQLVIYFSKYGVIAFCLVFVWLWFTKRGDQFNNRQLVLFALTIAIFTIGINKILELSFFRERPFVAHDVNLLSDKTADDPSFPSNHAGGSFALAFAMFWRYRKPGTIFIGFAILMALSRLFLGVHYPTDVFVGMLIALIVAAIVTSQKAFFEKLFTPIIRLYEKMIQSVMKR
ncbi:MAG TPA: phosphatase PAP2 family protein [Sporosarcina sp.]|nr:phosphatase PAP2 family protein [Sporosarcina sp.]